MFNIRMNCALCDTPIAESNDSDEHIILNAIGGRRKVPGIVCARCNGDAGSRWDSVLAQQLNSLSLLCNIKRERGETPSQTFESSAGEALRLHPGGSLSLAKPLFEKKSLGEGVHQLKIVARSKAEGREMLEGIKRKHPSVDIEKLLADADEQITYPQGAIKFSLQIGGPEAGRSLVKSALCLAAAHGVDPKACFGARDYLLQSAAEPCFGFYYERDLILNRPAEVPLHCVAVSNRGCEAQLLGYVEFFGVHRAVVCLAERYDGPNVHVAYAVDPVTGRELDLDFELALSRQDVAATYAYERIPDGSMEAAFNKVLPRVFKEHFERAKERAIAEAVDYAVKNCGAVQGEEMTPEQLWKVSGLIAQRMAAFILQTMVRPSHPPQPGSTESSQ